MKVINYPSEDNPLWNEEIEKILPYCYGQGIDVGCGGRSAVNEQYRVDLDKEVKPDLVAPADKIPMADNSFNYLTACHTLEHMKHRREALREWIRLVKPGGFVLIIVPDREYTSNRSCGPQELNGKQLMIHQTEYNLEEFLDFLSKNTDLGYRVVDSGIAGEQWSNFAVLIKEFN